MSGFTINPFSGAKISSTLATDLRAWWPLEGSPWLDSHSAGPYTLSATNAPGTGTGKIASCLDVELSSTQWLYLENHADFRPGDTDFSWSCWVNAESLGGANGVFGKWHPSTASENEYCLIELAGDFAFFVHDGTATQTSVSAGVSISTATWYHVVCWHDSVNNEIGIAVDDATPVTAAHSAGVNTGGSSRFEIGGYTNTGAAQWDGLIDEVGFWNKVVSAAEITELYNSGNAIGYSDL